jgi:hypothetical protein
MEEISFEEYLFKKKIDQKLFQKALPGVFNEWKTLFAEYHPDSFTAQKKFFVNKYRRLFLLKTEN